MTRKNKINGLELRDMLLVGAAMLERNRRLVDSLNVFPVPDGDTGTNMSMTMNSAVKELHGAKAQDAGSIAAIAARGALRGARGNSGVILSQLLRGFSRALEGKEEIDSLDMAQALMAGSEAAYKAVMKPKEGTILTVARVVAEKAMQNAEAGMNILSLVDNMIADGEEILARTPDMLPVLKEAGVVDSGGKGLLMIYRGYKMSLDGEEVPEEIVEEEENAQIDREENGAILFENDLENITFGYCTEFFIEHLAPSFNVDDLNRFQEHLMRIGDSVVVVGDAGLVKVHVHTDVPGKALQMALRFGELNGVKIENMREQNRQLMQERKAREKENGLVAISVGEGVDRIFKDLAVDCLVTGGQTMNPSAMDIERAIKRACARNVFVFPNNKNIILAAEQAKELVENETNTKVHIIPTTTITQGIAALVAYMPEAAADENVEAMTEAYKATTSGSVTYAVRDTELNGIAIKAGDVMGILEGDINVTGAEKNEVAKQLIDAMTDEDSSYITILYGEDVTKEEAEALLAEVEEANPMADVVLQYGGQPLYYYFISAE